jgi:hypothetical protein
MPRLTLATSNYNFSFQDAGLRSPEWMANTAAELGFDGLEWSDIPNIHPRSIAAGGVARWLARRGHILSMQQSWQSTRWRELPSLAKTVWREKGVAAAGRAVAEQALLIAGLPYIKKSLPGLRRVQEAAGRKLPAIVHPNEQHLGDRPRTDNIDYQAIRRSGDFGPLRFQVTAELLHAWGVLTDDPEETVEGMYRVMEERGFDEIAFDSHHAIMTRGGHSLPQPHKMAGKLARDRRLSELQICWRPDFGGEDDGFAPHQQILDEVNANLPSDQDLYVVVEARAGSLGEGDYLAHLGRLATTIRESLPDIQ